MPTISGLCVTLALLLPLPAPAFAQDAPPAQEAPMRVGGAIRPPQQTKRVNPEYPPEAQQARVTGVVILEAIIDTDGRVADVRILRSIPELDRAAADAVRQWEYEPTLFNGKPVKVIMTVTVNFSLLGGPNRPPAPGMPVRVMTGKLSDGRLEIWEISPERLAVQPSWNPLVAPEPPVSIGAAVQAARGWIESRQPGDRFDVTSVSLTRPSPDAWVYQVRFSLLGVPPAGTLRTPVAIVLFDGAVLEPTVQ